ncbi:adenine phosphoribosyltransferase [Amycolatopsis mediterranei S699]|uniref:Adenine phosphoribosyltransferase n=2 Tax=Amycolatopsis mediterranei TaxID=33910 RepID=A0A0H3DED8_AMYMU|nr:adenine phosphoribosyltransferase [Amycolatopsis mediterranei U32]AEK46031.1 adenine phosphoribosyltransferase [Amycolatopsis mediterranei S699]AGT87906.1 adenine phosphoribosyltransferase [Amycolatopsis mediterranei RB]KDO04051.1 adenine phosphoribosyltransferase [Amycolatopsis mediterranei]AFO80778.1 adenine phosphoribosyltransferase [Amycolatopsis mediterranei S699]
MKSGLRDAFNWHGDRTDPDYYADVTGWWRDPALLGHLGPALAHLFEGERPTVVLGPESRGCLLGPLVALRFDVGFVEVRKNRVGSSDSDAWRQRTTPPDYRDRHLTLGFRKSLLQSGDRVLFVDDWMETGGQADGVHLLVEDAGATWIGAATVVDGLRSNQARRRLNVRSLLHVREL